METIAYNIEGDPLPDGAHWRTMRPAREHLAHVIDDMRAALAAMRGEMDDDVRERLELSDDAGEFDIIGDVNARALEIKLAYWREDDDRLGGDRGPLARALLLLGFGGPNVYLDVLCDRSGSAEYVELSRHWSGDNRAHTRDHRALSIVDDYLSSTVVYD